MPIKVTCPHCTKDHDVADAVPQAEHRKRLKEKQDQIAELETTLAEAPDVAEFAKLRAQVDEYKAEGERGTAFAEHKIGDDPKVRKAFVRMYQSHVADLRDEGAKDADVPSFGDWLKDPETKGHPLLRAAYGAKPPADGGKPPKDPKAKVRQVPGTDDGVTHGDEPDADVITSADQLRAYFESSEYTRLPAAERVAKRRELQAQWDKVRDTA